MTLLRLPNLQIDSKSRLFEHTSSIYSRSLWSIGSLMIIIINIILSQIIRIPLAD